tara:strand:- start:107 stop:718 length:612 start_codon:yes stop_codon:yes gene_type:complete
MLAFLGWNPGSNKEIFTMQELIDSFSLDRVGKSGAKFDFDKTNWFNQQYLRLESNEKLAKSLQVILRRNGITKEDEFVVEVCSQLKERATFVKEIWEEGKYFFIPPKAYDEKIIRKKWNEKTSKFLTELKGRFERISKFNSKNIENEFKNFLDEKNILMGSLLPVLRLSLTGLGMGPSLFNIAELLGKEEVVNRMESAIKKIK